MKFHHFEVGTKFGCILQNIYSIIMTFITKTLTVFGLLIAFNTNAQNIIAEESGVTFSLKNMGSIVTGTFGGMKGDIVFDENNLEKSSFNTVIDVNTVNTNNKKRDTHLKTPDFFEADTYPSIAFVSTKIVKEGEKFVAFGNLSMHGISKEVSIIFTATTEGEKTTLVGNLALDRATYEVGKKRNVDITITCVIAK